MERGILTGLAAYRWGAWAWMAAVLMLSRDDLLRPYVAYALVVGALLLTINVTLLLRAAPDTLRRPSMVAAEVALGIGLLAGDGFVYERGHAFSVGQSLGVAWPLAGTLAAGVSAGPWAGGAAGILMGGARALSAWVNGVRDFDGERILSLATTAVLYVLAGVVSGHVTGLLRSAERQVSAARAREEMARALHDGVLQTLAVIERRAEDPSLARLARDQERRLRDYVAGRLDPDARGLPAALHAAGAQFEDAFGGRAQVAIAPDLPRIDEERSAALVGAVREAMTNAGKHGAASNVTVFVEPAEDRGVFCSVKDNGVGFDPASAAEGIGIAQSIRRRLEETGGRVEIESRTGGPTEIRMWLP